MCISSLVWLCLVGPGRPDRPRRRWRSMGVTCELPQPPRGLVGPWGCFVNETACRFHLIEAKCGFPRWCGYVWAVSLKKYRPGTHQHPPGRSFGPMAYPNPPWAFPGPAAPGRLASENRPCMRLGPIWTPIDKSMRHRTHAFLGSRVQSRHR